MKASWIGVSAAAVLIGGTAAIAQTAPQAPREQKVLTRAEVQAKVRGHFAKMDVNRDGALSTDEMTAARAHRKAERKVKQPNVAFDRIDVSNDGMISRDEFAKHREMRAEKRGPSSHRMHGRRGGMMGMRMADANKDGRITLAEAEGAALQHFDMADANRDGQVTREERKQMHQRMHAQRQQTRG